MTASSAQIIQVDALDCRVVDYDWAFAREQASAIDKHWSGLRAERPQLYNGRVFLTCGWTIKREHNRRLFLSRHFETDFKAFLAWRDFGFPDIAVANCFAAAALIGSDGIYVLGEMSMHTANAGKIYFPAGTPDLSDLTEAGTLDLAGSVMRELAEETGLAPPLVEPQSGWTIVHEGPRLACLKDVASRLSSVEMAERIETFIAAEKNPELKTVYRVGAAGDVIVNIMPAYVIEFLRSRF